MKITVIIPYKVDRGWLKDAIASVPTDVQLIVSQGEGLWPENFNKGLKQATGDLIKFLHEDDMLFPGAIDEYVKVFRTPAFNDVMFVHGNAYEIYMSQGRAPGLYTPRITEPTLNELLMKNVIHSATLIYRREVFEKVGSFCESSKVYSFEEYEFNLRCLAAGLKIGYINVPLAYYRRHPRQIIRTCDSIERKKNRMELLNSYRCL
jgi:GT2 family glycosyltransferase